MKKIHISILKIFHFINFIVKRTIYEIQGFQVFNNLGHAQDLPLCVGGEEAAISL